MKNHMDMSLETQFKNIDTLTWLPFIGKNYFASKRKILVVGESHYIPKDDDAEYYQNETWTREFILKEGMAAKPWYQETAKNALTREIEKTITGGLDSNIWNELAFFNLIQRLLDSREIEDRPTYDDVSFGLKNFKKVVAHLDPDLLIFCGVKAANHFHELHEDGVFEITPIDLPKVKLNGAYPRQFDLTYAGKTRRCTFVKHPSKGISAEKWAEIIFRE